MKKIAFILVALAAISLSSCIIVTDGPPGPDGYPGRAYFGISYDYYAPYSYWDNNPAVPASPYFDEYYPTAPGIYDFEYFVNRDDYWYGTYEIWVNRGGPGLPNGQRGYDGADTELLLVCNPDGPYEYRKSATAPVTVENLDDGSVRYTITKDGGGMTITMKKASAQVRPAQQPKFVSK